jgi:hypothetical protein
MVRLDIATGDWSLPTSGLCAIVEISGRKQVALLNCQCPTTRFKAQYTAKHSTKSCSTIQAAAMGTNEVRDDDAISARVDLKLEVVAFMSRHGRR